MSCWPGMYSCKNENRIKNYISCSDVRLLISVLLVTTSNMAASKISNPNYYIIHFSTLFCDTHTVRTQNWWPFVWQLCLSNILALFRLGTDSYTSHGLGLAPKPSHGTTSAPVKQQTLNLLAPELFFLILAHTVYKMWIIQEPNKLELWNKLHFKEKKTESINHI